MEGTLQAQPTTLSSLPPELLFEVFYQSALNDPLSPLTLRRVAWKWQSIVDTSPRLWQSICLSDVHPDYRQAAMQVEHWARRANPSKFDIQLNMSDPDNILPLLAPLLPSIDRWKSVQLNGGDHEPITFEHLGLSAGSLKCLQLHVYESDEDPDDSDDDSSNDAFTIDFNEMFTKWKGTQDSVMNLWLSNIPSHNSLPRLHFTHVTINETGGSGAQTRPQQILDFLLACPNLESFELDGWPTDGPDDPSLPSVLLPSLTTLHLKNTCSVRALLSRLVTPRLENLRLVHTNVDFPLRNDYDEDGDSDDEAGDYSQSPWSDHATGMGLRKLLKSSNPPIKVLEMDFCDMRTKDFLYVFERLPSLQDFRIVGSDMSDKVIAMLRPRHTTVLSYDKDGDLSAYSTVTKLVLPSLRVLRLHSCQRLTGSAIVDALWERVNWTDNHTPDATLKEVTIVGCDGVTSWDEHLLTNQLGGRLRTQL